MSRNDRPPQQTAARLTLERLEARDCPAGYWWSPINGTSSLTPENWMKGPGVPWARYNAADSMYGPLDDLFFQGGVANNADCELPAQLADSTTYGRALNGIHLVLGPSTTPGEEGQPPPPGPEYWGTVTTKSSFSVGTLEVDCGYVKQDNPNAATTGDAGTLTVKSSLDWTGGTLNSGSVAGHIDLAPGASGVAEPSWRPMVNGVVKLGSTLTLQGNETTETGSTLSMIGGTFEVFNASSFVAAAFSTLLLQPEKKPTDPPTAIKKITVDDKDFTPKEDGVISIKPKSLAIVAPTVAVAGQAVFELKGQEAEFANKGTTKIKQLTELRFTDLKDHNFCYFQNDTDAVTVLEGGSSITSNKKTSVRIEKGVMQIDHSVINGERRVAKVVVFPQSSALVIWKDATLKMSDSTDTRLKVEGGDLSIYCTLSVAINPRGPEASYIELTEWMHFHEKAGEYKAKMEVKNRSIGNGSQLPVNTEWHVAHAPKQISGSPEMTANSTDYTTTKTPISAENLYVKRIN